MKKFILYLMAGVMFLTVTCQEKLGGDKTFPVTGVRLSSETLKIVTDDKRNLSTTVVLDDVATLTATIVPIEAENHAITWKTSDPEVVSINNGVITALKVGKATITVTTAHNNKKAECLVIVKDHIRGIEVDPKTMNVEVGGDSRHIKATVLPEEAYDKTVIWKSRNPKIATVNENGDVSGVSMNKVWIVAYTVDGVFKDSCLVNAVVPVQQVILDKYALLLNPGDMEKVTASVLPVNTAQNVIWRSSDEDVAVVNDDGEVTATGFGEATIYATSEINDDKFAKCEVEVTTVMVKNLLLDKLTLNIKPNFSEQLTATIVPYNAVNQKVIWSSDKPEIATVSPTGLVEAKALGSATIKAMSDEDNTIFKECKVTVSRVADTYYLDCEDPDFKGLKFEIENAVDGDVFILLGGCTYEVPSRPMISKSISIKGEKGAAVRPVVKNSQQWQITENLPKLDLVFEGIDFVNVFATLSDNQSSFLHIRVNTVGKINIINCNFSNVKSVIFANNASSNVDEVMIDGCFIDGNNTTANAYISVFDAATNNPVVKTFTLKNSTVVNAGYIANANSTANPGQVLCVESCTFYNIGVTANPLLRFQNVTTGKITITRCIFAKQLETAAASIRIINRATATIPTLDKNFRATDFVETNSTAINPGTLGGGLDSKDLFVDAANFDFTFKNAAYETTNGILGDPNKTRGKK